MTDAQAVVLEGRGRLLPAGVEATARVAFGESEFTIDVGSDSRLASYRDLSTIAVQSGSALLVLGSGEGAERVLLTHFGRAQGALVREYRERRFAQLLADALVAGVEEPFDMLEYASGDPTPQRGVALLAYHPWGVVLAPLDERLAWIRIRRGEISSVVVDEPGGAVTVLSDGESAPGAQVVLPGLGAGARVHGERLIALRRGAQADVARLVSRLMPDARYATRQEAIRALVDGRPARPADLPTAWSAIEAAVLTEPSFAESYGSLVSKAGSLAEGRAIALAPEQPGGDAVKSWFFVPLPGNLVALELVSEGAHATYCFRGAPRADVGDAAAVAAGTRAAIRDVTDALVDSRFLREPMALPEEQLRSPANLRYRLALSALPSLAAARARFVARIVHRDDASWTAALDSLIAWHGSTTDDAATWPGRAAQESMVTGAADGEADGSAMTQEPQVTGGF